MNPAATAARRRPVLLGVAMPAARGVQCVSPSRLRPFSPFSPFAPAAPHGSVSEDQLVCGAPLPQGEG